MSTSLPIKPEGIDVAPATRAYLEALGSLGLLQGDSGSQTLHSDAHEVLVALHHVLAGGAVDIEIHSEGAPSMVEDLNTMLRRAVDETNQLAQQEWSVLF
jgi:hypothetical protein